MHRLLALALAALALTACKSVGNAVSGDLDFSDDAETNLITLCRECHQILHWSTKLCR